MLVEKRRGSPPAGMASVSMIVPAKLQGQQSNQPRAGSPAVFNTNDSYLSLCASFVLVRLWI